MPEPDGRSLPRRHYGTRIIRPEKKLAQHERRSGSHRNARDRRAPESAPGRVVHAGRFASEAPSRDGAPGAGGAVFRLWVRSSEIALVALAILAGGTSGLVASLMGGATHWLHVTLFGPGAEYGLSALRNADPVVLVLMPIVGGLLLGLLNLGLARWWPARADRSDRSQRALRRPPVAG